MLMSLRHAVHKKAVKYLIFGVLILSFGMWGIADLFIPSADYNEVVMTAGEREFTYIQVEQNFRNELQALRIDSRTADNAILQSVLDYTLERLAIGALNSQEIKSLGIGGDRASVLQNIRDNANFYDAFGNFDERLFRQFLAISGLSESDYMALIAEDIGAQYWLSGLQASLAVPRSLGQAYGEYLRQVRKIAYVVIDYDKLAQDPINDADLRSYYNDNNEDYRVEEARDFSLIDITRASLAAEITPSEADIRALYDSGTYSRTEPERRDISFIVFGDKATADKAYASLALGAGVSMAEAASAADLQAQNLQAQARDDIADEILADKAFGLAKVGDVAEVFEGAFGWVVLKLDGVSLGKSASFEDVRDEIAADILADRATDVIYEAAQNLEDAVSGGASLAEAANLTGLELRRHNNFDDLPPNIIAESFSLQTGEASTLLEHPSIDGGLGGFFMLQLDAVKESHIAEFGAVKDRVRQDLLQYRREQVLRKSATQVEEGALDLNGFATLWGGQVKYADVSLNDLSEDGDYPQVLNGAEFRTNPVGYTVGFSTNGEENEFILARLESVNLREAQEGQENLGSQILSRLMQNMVVQAYENFLRKKYRITYNREALNGIILGDSRLAGQG